MAPRRKSDYPKNAARRWRGFEKQPRMTSYQRVKNRAAASIVVLGRAWPASELTCPQCRRHSAGRHTRPRTTAAYASLRTTKAFFSTGSISHTKDHAPGLFAGYVDRNTNPSITSTTTGAESG